MGHERNNSTCLVTAALSFAAGLSVSFVCISMERRRWKKHRQDAGASQEGEDLSLFYGNKLVLNTTPESKKFLSAELYGQMVQNSVICCLDCLITRKNTLNNKTECLLVQRATEPVKGAWWLPGGRIYKGETFFDAAVRKTKEETGLNGKPIQILGFYNTFFPTSHWDTETEKGTQTVQPVVLVELQEDAEVLLDQTCELFKWISIDPVQAEKDDEDKYVVEALRRYQTWREMFGGL
mmetsp:Transcript_27821/g.39820  ORF Transcript_27821/g.39820 Transcript_27821/m.39820 type:complete len:237 (+) Transcript_27821:45-755(+)|eukprot:CAMPEP_0172417854 /NCGR_PEP_ID=MMETSP1064-20121228/4341_1 /TAXON_ID=202472 /ORGANISM="Aulacoseira subarctica , Strain CCAP 1002/5" /LENGTH=236 /DNA_ID=CAMNT_0013156391 /DNA_START=44 /DNA_END=754 /DNA_ORIENTATION=-